MCLFYQQKPFFVQLVDAYKHKNLSAICVKTDIPPKNHQKQKQKTKNKAKELHFFAGYFWQHASVICIFQP